MPVSSTAASALSERDVHLLVDMVRLSRVTLLVAEPGSAKSEFLRSSVLPLLNEKKRGSPGGEIGILFDEWSKAPLPALQARIRASAGAAGIAVPAQDSQSLVENLEALQEAMTETFLIVLDRFEDFLRAPQDSAGRMAFEAAFVHIANDPTLRVNFLMAIEQDAEPLLANLRRHIPRLGYSSVRLPAAPAGRTAAERAPAAEAIAETRRARSPQREALQPAARSERAVLNVVPVSRPATAPLERRDATPEIAPAVAPAVSADITPAVPEKTASAQGLEKAAVVTSDGGTDKKDHTLPVPERTLPNEPGRRSGFRLAWVPAVLVVGAIVYVLWQPQADEMARRISGRGSDAPVSHAEPSEVPPPPVPAAAIPDTSARTSAVGSAPAEPVPSKPTSPPRTSTADSKPDTPALESRAAAPAAAAKETREKRKPETASPKAPAPRAASGLEAREPRKPEAVAAKPAEAPAKPAPESPKPQVPASDAATVAAPAKPVATAPVAASTQRPAEAASGPVLRINVRSEAQRAWAKKMIGPLKERGIQVASIRLVPPHGEIAHIRYSGAAERTEAMRVASALSDLGLSARQLRQVGGAPGSLPTRQFELWLAAEETQK